MNIASSSVNANRQLPMEDVDADADNDDDGDDDDDDGNNENRNDNVDLSQATTAPSWPTGEFASDRSVTRNSFKLYSGIDSIQLQSTRRWCADGTALCLTIAG
jgi:hypothetical protein